jgi:hypothetical protein
MPKVKEIYYTETDICNIDDLKLFDRNVTKIDKISLSNRMFTYPTDKGKTRLIFDILKQPIKRPNNELKVCDRCDIICNACLITNGISNWTGIEITNINTNIITTDDQYYNLEFNRRNPSVVTFLSENKITSIDLPCLNEMLMKASRSPAYDADKIEQIKEPIVKSIEGLVIDFYKYNPEWDSYVPNTTNNTQPLKQKILMVSGSKIIIWDLYDGKNEYKLLDLNSNLEFNRLQLVITDADWNLNGEYFVITLKSKIIEIENFYFSIIFDINLIYIALIEEQRSRKVLILNNKTKNNVKTFYLFTIGKKIKIDRQNNRINDYKFGMYTVKKTNTVII